MNFAEIGGANDKSKPEKVQILKTGGKNSKYFHGASLVCISDHFEQILLACDFFVYKQWLFLNITLAKIGGANDKSKPGKVQI